MPKKAELKVECVSTEKSVIARTDIPLTELAAILLGRAVHDEYKTHEICRELMSINSSDGRPIKITIKIEPT